MKVTFRNEELITNWGYYGSGGTALQLLNAETGELFATASVNLEPYGAPKIQQEQLWIKNWSENKGILEALVEAGVVTVHSMLNGDPLTYPTGYVEATLADLTKAAKEELQKESKL